MGELPAALLDASVILAVSENYPLPGVDFGAQEASAALINRLAAQHGDRLAVVALRDPYDLAQFPTVSAYLCACSSRECSALAAALVVLGEDDAPGRLPVSIPGVAALGANRWRT